MAPSHTAWNYIAYFVKRQGNLTLRVPMPYNVIRAPPPKIQMDKGYLTVEWTWGKRDNPLIETERPKPKCVSFGELS